MSLVESKRGSARSGIFTFIALAMVTAAVALLFSSIRPATVEQIERDLWIDWARATVDSQGENIVGLLLRDRKEACQRLLDHFGDSVITFGDDAVLRTEVRYVRVLNAGGEVFASWTRPDDSSASDYHWTDARIPLATDVGREPVGWLEVSYKFNESTLGTLPNIRQLAELHRAARWLVGLLVAVMLVAVVVNILRLRERSARLQSQQVTLDLARQMCHELRNGLWAFSLEGKNLRQLFETIEQYFAEEPRAVEEAARRLQMSPADLERLKRGIRRYLADQHLDPQTDVLTVNAMARDAQNQVENFSRYINLTVEQLDRNLLGAASQWEPEPVRVSEAWNEACDLMSLRLHSAGVERPTTSSTGDDWVMVDRRSLVHVFVNLAKNAIEAMRDLPGRRELTFTVETADGWVECTVGNLGKPIPAKLLPLVFQPGFSTKAGAGRGLGLALVRETIIRMNGRIRVTSDETGTRFTIRIPAHVVAADAEFPVQAHP